MDTIEVTFVNGPDAGKKLQIGDRPMTFGRTAASDVVMNWDGAVSSKHFAIAREEGAFILTDLQSTNGTRVNNVAVKRHQLQHGDRIQTGNTQCLVAVARVENSGEERRPPPLGTLVPKLPTPTPAERRFTNPIESSVIDFVSDRAQKAVDKVEASDRLSASSPPPTAISPSPNAHPQRRDSHPIEDSFEIDLQAHQAAPPRPAHPRPTAGSSHESALRRYSNPIEGSIVDFPLPEADAGLNASDTSGAIDVQQLIAPAQNLPIDQRAVLISECKVPRAPQLESVAPRQARIRQVRLRILSTTDLSTPTSLMWLRPGQLLLFGKSYNCDCSISHDNTMSGRHFEVRCSEQSCDVVDMGSLGGTWLNGQRVTAAPLYNGDKLLAGRTQFSVEVETPYGVLERPQGEVVEAGPGPVVAPAMCNQGFSATRIHCPSGLYQLRGKFSAEASLTIFPQAFHSLGQIYLLLDFGRFNLPYPTALDMETTKLFHWLPAPAASKSPHLLELNELTAWPEYLDEATGADAAIILLSDQGKAELLTALQENLRDPTRGGEVFNGILGFCWPSVLTALLEQGSHGLGDRLFQQITAVVSEAASPNQWQFFARNETIGERILANCKRAGLTITSST